MKKLDVRLLRMIRHTKGQFVSVAIIIAIALCIYIMFNVTTINIRNAVDSYYEKTNISDLTIELMRIPENAAGDLKAIPGILEVQGRITADVPLQVEDRDEKVTLRIISLPEKGGTINRLHNIEGNSDTPGDDDIVLIEQFTKARNIKVDDIVTPRIGGRLHELKVSGIAASSEFIYLMENEQSLMPSDDKFGVGYVNEAFAQSALGYRGSYNVVLIKLDGQHNADDIIKLLEKRLDKYGLKRITKLEDQLSYKVLEQEVDGYEMMAAIMPLMFLSVAAIIISIMLSRIVNNDRMAIGVLKALGCYNTGVLFHYTKYALAIGLSGAILGVAGGLLLSGPMSKLFVSYFNVPLLEVEVQYYFIINAIILTSLFCIGSGLLGARGILRIMPADSMRPEAPKTGRRILLERVTPIWKHIPFSWKMVVRNIFRNKRRFVFLMLGLALAYGINVVPLYMWDAVLEMFDAQYSEFQKMDYNIDFVKPLNEKAIVELNNLIDAERIEPRIEYPFELVNGWRKKSVGVIGVPRQTTLYTFVDPEYNVLSLPEDGIFLTEAIGRALKVKEGDTITVKSFIPGREDVRLTVKGIVKQYLGSNAYMNIKAMEEELLEKQLITGVSVVSGDNIKEKLKDAKNIAAVRSVIDMKNAFNEYLDIMNAAILAYLLFGGVLGFALIYNATVISISERTNEFSSLRVMGFDKRDIFGMISKENFVMALVSSIVGIPFGAAMIQGMVQAYSTDMMTMPLILTPGIFIQAAVASAVFVVVAQLATRKKVYNLNFIDALKSRIS
ncbi:MAG TPA: FtsX-like permease family protein [Clostridia bacterium]|nr:FtsX-like permease family protein [Clostridia bacterium]